MKGDFEKLKTFFLSYDPQPPIVDPDRFQGICKQLQVGASSLFSTLHDAMSANQMSNERQKLTKMILVVVTYIMTYSQSQRANWFRVSLARTRKQFGISQMGLASLLNLGIAAHLKPSKPPS